MILTNKLHPDNCIDKKKYNLKMSGIFDEKNRCQLRLVVWGKSVSGFNIGSAVVQLLKAGSMHPANYLSYAIDVSTAIKQTNCPSPTNNPAKWPACFQISSKRE